jgi:inosine/xanthosine triphosphate pyrophosphatase family protein
MIHAEGTEAEICEAKVREAVRVVKGPVLVEDTSLR